MPGYTRFALIIITGFLLTLPLATYVKKFADIDTSPRSILAFNPTKCYACQTCSCEYTFNEEKTYTLNQYDKTHCRLEYEYVKEAVKAGNNITRLEIKDNDYKEFRECIEWYTTHPTIIVK